MSARHEASTHVGAGDAQMITALVRLRGALQAATLPLDLPGVEEVRTSHGEMLDQLINIA